MPDPDCACFEGLHFASAWVDVHAKCKCVSLGCRCLI
jgi:hypothetical protein